MKKLFILVAVLFTMNAYAAQTATGGTINFYGQVTNTSCTVSVNGQGSDADVYLSPIARNEFKAADTLYKTRPFNIEVSDCIASTGDLDSDDNANMTINVNFNGGNLATFDSSYLANTLGSYNGAKGVYLILTTDTNKKIDIGMNDQAVSTANNLNGILQFNYNVSYVATDVSVVTAGNVNSYVTYQIKYD